MLLQRLLLIGRGQEQVYVPRVRTHLPRITSTYQQESSGVPKLYMLLAKSLTPVPFLQACHSLLP